MRLLLALLLVLIATAASADTDLSVFDTRFEDATLRIDYTHTGDAEREFVAVAELWRQGTWAGSRTRLVDDLDLGRYYAKLYDAAGGELIWSRGFDSYFGEWQTTGPAGEGVLRTYHESALAPFPRLKVEFTLESRREGKMVEIFRTGAGTLSPLATDDGSCSCEGRSSAAFAILYRPIFTRRSLAVVSILLS